MEAASRSADGISLEELTETMTSLPKPAAKTRRQRLGRIITHPSCSLSGGVIHSQV